MPVQLHRSHQKTGQQATKQTGFLCFATLFQGKEGIDLNAGHGRVAMMDGWVEGKAGVNPVSADYKSIVFSFIMRAIYHSDPLTHTVLNVKHQNKPLEAPPDLQHHGTVLCHSISFRSMILQFPWMLAEAALITRPPRRHADSVGLKI